MILLENVTKYFLHENIKTYALSQVNLKISDGEFISIVGPSGSGKTTLVGIISGLTEPDQGKVYYGQHELSALSKEDKARHRARNVGLIFQDSGLIDSLNVLDNVLIPIKLAGKKITTQDKDKALSLLEELGIRHRAKHTIGKLSGGQKQRVGIARALINDPQLIIADEPTGNLDKQNTTEIVAILDKLNKKGVTILVVTHDPLVSEATKTQVILDNGNITNLNSG